MPNDSDYGTLNMVRCQTALSNESWLSLVFCGCGSHGDVGATGTSDKDEGKWVRTS